MLKKISAIIAVIVAIQGGLAIAEYKDVNTEDARQAGFAFAPSNGVKLFYLAEAGTKPQNYNIASKHTSGDKIYITSNVTTGVFTLSGVDGETNNGHALDGTESSITGFEAGESTFTGWSRM